MKLKTGFILAALFFWLLTPYAAGAGISVVGGLSHEKSAGPGEVYKGVIYIGNTADEPQEVKVYQTDYLFFCDGSNIYGEPGKTPRSNADWISFSPRRFTIPPRGRSPVNYTVKAPDGGTLAGTYWSMLMVEGVSRDSPEFSGAEESRVQVGIRQVMRYGIQMVTHIGDTGTRKLKFLDTKLLKEGEKRVLQVDMENIGERWMRPFLWADLYDEKGSYIGRFEGGRLRIYPGASVRFRVDLSQAPEGKYKALVVADCGGDDIFGATYTLKFE